MMKAIASNNVCVMKVGLLIGGQLVVVSRNGVWCRFLRMVGMKQNESFSNFNLKTVCNKPFLEVSWVSFLDDGVVWVWWKTRQRLLSGNHGKVQEEKLLV